MSNIELPKSLVNAGCTLEMDGNVPVAKNAAGEVVSVHLHGNWFGKPSSGRPRQERVALASEIVRMGDRPFHVETVNVVGEGKRAGPATYIRPLSEETVNRKGEPYPEIVTDEDGTEYGVVSQGMRLDPATFASVFQRHAAAIPSEE